MRQRTRKAGASARGLRIVVAGPLPPPHGGVTGFVMLMQEHASQRCESVRVFDTSTHGDVATSGTWSLRNVVRAAELWPRMAMEARRRRPSVIQIEAGGYLGLVKSAALALATAEVPVVLSIHSADMKGDLSKAGRAGKPLIRGALRRASAVRVMYQGQLDELAAFAPEVPLDRYRIIRPFIEAPPTSLSRPVRGASLRLVSVGTAGVRKGTFDLLRALPALGEAGRSFHCDIFGGEEREGEMLKLTRLSYELGLSQIVTFHGAVPAKEVREHVERADAFVLPSRAEGLPLALMEAMSMGLPVIVTAVGAIPDAVRQPELPPIDPGDVQALAASLIRVADDPELRRRCGEANLRRTREYLSADAVIPLYIEMWRRAAQPCDEG